MDYAPFKKYLAGMGVTDPSQLQYRDASVNTEGMSQQDIADAGYNSRSNNIPGAKATSGLSGWYTPTGQYIPAGDVYRDGHNVFTMQSGADGKPAFSSHVDAPDLGAKDLAMMVAMVVGGAFGAEALGGLAGVGGAAGDTALVSGMDLAADGGMNALSGFGAGAGTSGIAGLSNGMWDVLPEAAGSISSSEVPLAELGSSITPEVAAGSIEGAAPAVFNPAVDSQLASSQLGLTATDTTAGGIPSVGGAGNSALDSASTYGSNNVSDYNYTNEADKLSDASTQAGQAVDGTINSGVPTTGGTNITPATGAGSGTGTGGPVTPATGGASLLDKISGLSTADLLKLGLGLAGLGGAAGSGGGSTPGSYGGKIPTYGAQRTQYGNDASRQPGSAPQRYFSDMNYVPDGTSTLTQASPLTQANNVQSYGAAPVAVANTGNTGGITTVNSNNRQPRLRGKARRGFAAGGIADLGTQSWQGSNPTGDWTATMDSHATPAGFNPGMDLPGVVNGVQMHPDIGGQTGGMSGQTINGVSRGSLYDMKANPGSAVGSPYAQYLTGGNGNGPQDFNLAAAMGDWRGGGDPTNKRFMPGQRAAGNGPTLSAIDALRQHVMANHALNGQNNGDRGDGSAPGMGIATLPPQNGFDRRPRNGPTGDPNGIMYTNPGAPSGGNTYGGPAPALGTGMGSKFQQTDPVHGSAYAAGGIAGLDSRHLKGPGDGLSDSIPATIDDNQPAKLASDEFVVPADVVSALGGGSSEGGARKLYAMMDRIRQQAHGSKQQVRQVKEKSALPG